MRPAVNVGENQPPVLTLAPPKEIGELSRNNRLTRAGLMHRYHAFLIGELQTLSFALYGSRDAAFKYCPIDEAVDQRCVTIKAGGRLDPFFDQRKLDARARAVLKSLKIDVERAEVR